VYTIALGPGQSGFATGYWTYELFNNDGGSVYSGQQRINGTEMVSGSGYYLFRIDYIPRGFDGVVVFSTLAGGNIDLTHTRSVEASFAINAEQHEDPSAHLITHAAVIGHVDASSVGGGDPPAPTTTTFTVMGFSPIITPFLESETDQPYVLELATISGAYLGAFAYFISGSNAGIGRKISAYAYSATEMYDVSWRGTTLPSAVNAGHITVSTPFPNTPYPGDQLIILGRTES
jgi:hypothetical protein